MTPETNLNSFLRTLNPELHDGEYVFCRTSDFSALDTNDLAMILREREGTTLILRKETVIV